MQSPEARVGAGQIALLALHPKEGVGPLPSPGGLCLKESILSSPLELVVSPHSDPTKTLLRGGEKEEKKARVEGGGQTWLQGLGALVPAKTLPVPS